MPAVHSLARRSVEPEVMDDASLDGDRHAHALRGLAWLNTVSGSSRLIWDAIAKLADELGRTDLRILDIATGAGDVPIYLWQRAARAGWNPTIHAVDASTRAVAFAAERAERAKAGVTFSTCDVIHDPLPQGYDVVISSLFLHHLEDEHAPRFLTSMATSARHLVLVSDLWRSRFNLALTYFATHVYTTSQVIRIDGTLSVRAAYTVDEVLEVAQRAGLQGATVSKHWPCRYLLAWKPRTAPGLRSRPPIRRFAST